MLGPDEVVQMILEGSERVPKSIIQLYGIIPRAIKDIFGVVRKEMADGAEIVLSMNYFEIYNEKLMDLLAVSHSASQKALVMRETKEKSFIVEGATNHAVENIEDFFEALKLGN